MQRYQAGYRGSRYANGEDNSRAMRPQTISSKTLVTSSRSSVQEPVLSLKGSHKGDKRREGREEERREGGK